MSSDINNNENNNMSSSIAGSGVPKLDLNQLNGDVSFEPPASELIIGYLFMCNVFYAYVRMCLLFHHIV